MPVIRKQLKPADVYPEDIRYNDGTGDFETLINGEWTPNPDADPRRQSTYPPRLTADTKCDAAQSVVDAFTGQITDILTAIDNGGTAFTIAGIILSLLSFGVFAVFISLALVVANAMLDVGTGALEAAFTSTVWSTLKCILDCNMDSNGRLNDASLAQVKIEIGGQIGGLAGTLLNGMLDLAGFGGVNNLGALGTATGDCSECDCAQPCPDADSFYNGTVNSITDNGDGTITFNVSSAPNAEGVEYVGWGDRDNPASPCCVLIALEDVTPGLGSQGGAVQVCGSGSESPTLPLSGECYHFWLFYHNFSLTTPFVCNATFGIACP